MPDGVFLQKIIERDLKGEIYSRLGRITDPKDLTKISFSYIKTKQNLLVAGSTDQRVGRVIGQKKVGYLHEKWL